MRQPEASGAAEQSRLHRSLSVGLHVDLCEWTFSGESWHLTYERVPLADAAAVTREVAAQMEIFRRLMGCDPTHLDSHQHVHRDEPLRSILLNEAAELGIPLRSFDRGIRYCGDFYGQSDKGYACPEAISVDALLKLIASLPAGTTEMGCHPGSAAGLESTYKHEREIECQTLCDPRVRAALEEKGIVLCSFGSLRLANN